MSRYLALAGAINSLGLAVVCIWYGPVQLVAGNYVWTALSCIVGCLCLSDTVIFGKAYLAFDKKETN